MVSSRTIISPDGEESSIATAVVDEEGCRLLGGLDAVHDLHPDVDHLDGLGSRSEVANILIERHLVVLGSWGLCLFGLGLDVVPDALQVGFILGRELSESEIHNLYVCYKIKELDSHLG